MSNKLIRIASRNAQHGAALVVGLLLLVVITVLAISGMNTAATELAMARNDQAYEDAFQAAETGLANALSQGVFNTNANANLQTNVNTRTNINTTMEIAISALMPDISLDLEMSCSTAFMVLLLR